MKHLQKNYTTPEQSKRLLELGVPTDSADCYLTRFGIDEEWEVKVLNNIKYSELEISNQDYCLPCWSVGRLIEIYEVCLGSTYQHTSEKSLIDELLDKLPYIKKVNGVDFSKLEE